MEKLLLKIGGHLPIDNTRPRNDYNLTFNIAVPAVARAIAQIFINAIFMIFAVWIFALIISKGRIDKEGYLYVLLWGLISGVSGALPAILIRRTWLGLFAAVLFGTVCGLIIGLFIFRSSHWDDILFGIIFTTSINFVACLVYKAINRITDLFIGSSSNLLKSR